MQIPLLILPKQSESLLAKNLFDRVIVGGISAGGVMAVDILFNNEIPARGVW